MSFLLSKALHRTINIFNIISWLDEKYGNLACH